MNGVTTIFAYGAGLNVLTEFTDQGIPKHDYIYAGNLNVARVDFDAAGVPVNKTYYHADHLGSAIGITDNETTLVFERTYSPYGDTFAGAGTLTNTHQYTGKEKEDLTENYYYGARHYNPKLGRFLSTDPAGIDVTNPQSWNRYAYVQNNPFTYVDPDGNNPLFFAVASELGGIGGQVFRGGADLLVAYGVINTNDPSYIYLDAVGQSFEDFGKITGAIALVSGLAVIEEGAVKSVGSITRNALKEKTFSRAVSTEELEEIKRTGFLRGGRSTPGEPTYFTEGAFTKAKKAHRRLSLRGELRDYRVDFRIKNNPDIIGPRTVEPLPGKVGTGGGREYYSSEPVEVEILNIKPLKKPR